MVKESEYVTIYDLAIVRSALNVMSGLNCFEEPNESMKAEVVRLLSLMQLDLEGRNVPVIPDE